MYKIRTNPNTNTESKSPTFVTKGILAVNINRHTNTATRSPAFITKGILAVTPSDAEVASVESGTWAWQAGWLDVLGPDRKHVVVDVLIYDCMAALVCILSRKE